MKAYFIFNDSSLKEDKLLPILSALVAIDTAGKASNLLDAVDIIRQKHPDSFLFDSTLLDGCGDELPTPRLDGKGPLVILPANYQIRESCTYVGVSIDCTELCGYNWLMRSIGRMIRQYHRQDAR